ncbi:MAG: 5'/3'-nucleotidase SurE [Elusimicrobia bacterium]|nr:5'/3'-nucleotidase SurE [Elusimicrobiota bacterium]
MTKKKILITNDDGIYGAGLEPLKKALRAAGQVYSVVPEQERSTASHSLTLHKPLRVKQIGRRDYILNGTPADCVRFAVLHLIPKIDLVVSGINSGVNLGEDVIYSGTVAGAVEAAILRIPALAVSRPPDTDPRAFVLAAKMAARVVRAMLRYKNPKGICFNLNVPASKNGTKESKGIRVTHLGHRLYGKTVTARQDPRGHRYYWLLAKKVLGVPTPGSDVESFDRGYAVLTPLTLDWTATAFLSELKKWKI